MEKITVIEQNKSVGRLKEVYIIIHVDKNGNEGILAEQFVRSNGSKKIAADLTPYVADLPVLEAYAEELNKKIGIPCGMTIKVKRFFTLDSFNQG